MPYCVKCGQHFDDSADYCPYCGTANKLKINAGANSGTTDNVTGNNARTVAGELYNKAFDTKDSTYEMNSDDVRDNKFMAILSYLGALVFVPFFAEKNSKFVRYHAVQGMNLFIISVIVGVIAAIAVKLLSFNSSFLGGLWDLVIITPISLAIVALSVIGIVNVVRGHSKELPVIGKIKFVKFDARNYN